MTTYVGGDVVAMRGLARSMEDAAVLLDEIVERLGARLHATAWSGPDAQAFRERWAADLMPRATRAAAGIRDAGLRAAANADAQESTSRADVGGLVGVTTDGAHADGTGAAGLPGGAAGIVTAGFPVDPVAAPPGAGPGEPGGPAYVVGPPSKPSLTWDEDFEYDSKEPEVGDYVDWAAWSAKEKAAHFHPGLQDAADFYSHYMADSGEPRAFDYEAAYRDDEGIRANVDDEVVRAQRGVEELIAAGSTEFSVTGDASASSAYPVTENWQKTIGGYQQWSSADVKVDGDQVTMEIVVHAEDHYNFNRGQADIASGAPDDANGRFTELGWAKPFDSSGSVRRTVTWTLGAPESALVSGAPSGRGDQ